MYLQGFLCAGDFPDSISKTMKHLVAGLQFPAIGKASMDACKTACMQDMDCKAHSKTFSMDCMLVRKQSKLFQGPGKGDIP